jgi:hypothetical protein
MKEDKSIGVVSALSNPVFQKPLLFNSHTLLILGYALVLLSTIYPSSPSSSMVSI